MPTILPLNEIYNPLKKGHIYLHDLLQLNKQIGSAYWYREKFPDLPDIYYEMLEASHFKKLKGYMKRLKNRRSKKFKKYLKKNNKKVPKKIKWERLSKKI